VSDKYILVHEGLSRWINAPNNGGECCADWQETVDELNRLLDRIKRLEEAGDEMMEEPCEYTFEQWFKAKEVKP
jgi:hypothetical protein